MRPALARHPPAVRHLVILPPACAIAGRRSERAGTRAVQVGGATIAFLVAYATLTVMHDQGHDPDVVQSITTIPLFARIVLSAALAPLGGLVAGGLSRRPARVLRALPAALAVAIGLAVLAVLVFA